MAQCVWAQVVCGEEAGKVGQIVISVGDSPMAFVLLAISIVHLGCCTIRFCFAKVLSGWDWGEMFGMAWSRVCYARRKTVEGTLRSDLDNRLHGK